ncbi:MAG: RluA family pseudouridine synthase [Clostridia bacterium]|nr:RluA family pseudouridine synthase [Clostridia bacterium]
MKTFTAFQDTNLKDFTDSVYPQGSFCFSALLKAKDIKVNGVRAGKNMPVKRGDEVIYYTTKKQEEKPSHTVVYEDENIYIADKFSGVSSEALSTELSSRGEFYAVHRLDRNTQGLIVFAKTKYAEDKLNKAFKERAVQKTYIALCKNSFKESGATLCAYLLKDESKGLVKVFASPQKGAEKILTEYSVEEQRGDIALVKIYLHTGKTHQIRAHFAFIGCPVLGDEKYGDEALNAKYSAKRQRLIAKYLQFNLEGSLAYLNGKTFESGFSFDKQ